MRSLQLLAASGVRVPRTVMASDPSGLKEMVRVVGGVPVLVKLLAMNDKSGVMICESLQSLEAALEAILGLGQNIVVQQYLRGAKGRDLRVLVVGGRVVGRDAPEPARRAVRARPAPRRSLRAGRAAAGLRARRADAARVLRLEVCAVDMLDVKGVPRVFEVNSSPSISEAEDGVRRRRGGAHRRARRVALAEARRGAARAAAAAQRRPRGRLNAVLPPSASLVLADRGAQGAPHAQARVTSSVAALALAPAVLARAEPRTAEAAKSYRIETTGTTARSRREGRGRSSSPSSRSRRCTSTRRRRSRSRSRRAGLDAREDVARPQATPSIPKAEGAALRDARSRPRRPGKQEAKAKLDFFICSDQWCVKQTRDVTVAVNVK